MATSPRVVALERQLVRFERGAADPRFDDAVEDFWRAASATPLIEEVSDSPHDRIVTFLWRDAQAEQVLLFVNRLTDERNLDDSLLRHIDGTDVWHISYRMRADWRASYAFLPQNPGQRTPWTDGADQVAVRAALDRGLRDPRNSASGRNRAGIVQSVASLPEAPEDRWGTRRENVARGSLAKRQESAGRDVWVYEPPGGAAPGIPILIALDGEVWADNGALPTIVDNLIADGRMRPTLVVMPDSGGRDARWNEMDAEGSAVAAITDRLLPWVRDRYDVTKDPREVVVAGQSLGGLTALRAVLSRPDEVGAALSLSASLWQDDLSGLLDQAHRTRVHLEVGLQEWVLREPNRTLAERLAAHGAEVRFVEYNGGHDYACWRIGMAQGLQSLLPAL